MVRRNRRNVSRRNGRRPRGRLANSRRVFDGRRVTLSVNPKPAAYNPWNTVCVQRRVISDSNKAFTLTLGYLNDAFRAQLGFDKLTGTFVMRLISIAVYDLGGRPIELNIGDYVSDQSNTLGTSLIGSMDYPGRSSFSRVKLVWPASVSANSVRVATGDPRIFATGSIGSTVGNDVESDSNYFLLKIWVLWKPESSGNVEVIPSTVTIADEPSNSVASNSDYCYSYQPDNTSVTTDHDMANHLNYLTVQMPRSSSPSIRKVPVTAPKR